MKFCVIRRFNMTLTFIDIDGDSFYVLKGASCSHDLFFDICIELILTGRKRLIRKILL